MKIVISFIFLLLLSLIIFMAFEIFNEKKRSLSILNEMSWDRRIYEDMIVDIIDSNDTKTLETINGSIQIICFSWGRKHANGLIKYNEMDKVIANYLKDRVYVESSDDLIMIDEYIKPNLK